MYSNMILLSISDNEKIKQYLEDTSDWAVGFVKNILIAVVIYIVGKKLIKWIMKLISNSFQKTSLEPMVTKFLMSLLKFILYAVLAIAVINVIGIPTTSLIAILSTAGLTIGLALQGSLSNFAGGVLILIFKPFRIGDYIIEDTSKNEGTVAGIDLFYTKLLTIDNKVVVVPNGTLANSSLTNVTNQKERRVDIKIGVSYNTDIKKAKSVLRSVIEAEERILPDKEISVYVDDLGESQITLGTRAWVKSEDYWKCRWDLLENYKNTFDDNDIEIPYNYLNVIVDEKK